MKALKSESKYILKSFQERSLQVNLYFAIKIAILLIYTLKMLLLLTILTL